MSKSYKTLINTSFLHLVLELEEHIQDGWYIDKNNLPFTQFFSSTVHLVKDNEEVVQEEKSEEVKPVAKRAGRPPKAE